MFTTVFRREVKRYCCKFFCNFSCFRRKPARSSSNRLGGATHGFYEAPHPPRLKPCMNGVQNKRIYKYIWVRLVPPLWPYKHVLRPIFMRSWLQVVQQGCAEWKERNWEEQTEMCLYRLIVYRAIVLIVIWLSPVYFNTFLCIILALFTGMWCPDR